MLFERRGRPGFLRVFGADIKSDGRVDLADHFRAAAGRDNGFFDGCSSFFAAYHSDIGMFFLCNLIQTELVVAMPPCDNDKI